MIIINPDEWTLSLRETISAENVRFQPDPLFQYLMRKSKKEPKVPGQRSFVGIPQAPKADTPSNGISPKLRQPPPQNQLYYGDNLDILRRYIKDESVDLCYIDPPFNSKRNYNQIYNNIGREDKAQAQAFTDTWTWDEAAILGFNDIIANHGAVFTKQSIELILGLERVLGKGSLLSYLVHMTLRIAEIYRVLRSSGSFYLHCDPTASHYIKLVLDSIFCAGRQGEYRNEIVWKRINSKGLAFTRFASNHDVIFYYSKTKDIIWNAQYKAHDPKYIADFYKYVEPETGRRYRLGDLTNPNKNRPNLTYEFLGITRVWRWTKERMQKAYKDGIVIQSSKGGVPALKRYLDEQEGTPIDDIWVDILPVQSQGDESLGYPTQKPETLLERIIKASSNEGDVILDAYCGCGTSVAVSERLNRNWIGMDITYQSISLILKRLEEHFGATTLKNIKLSGVPEDFASAEALANKEDDKTRKEFEKWAILTYSNNRAIINEKKGGDGGVDGTAFLLDFNKKGEQNHKEIIFSVKSNKTLQPSVVRDLNGTIEREGAVMGFLLTLYPMPNLVKESKKYGMYNNTMLGQTYPKIQVISVEEILFGKTMKIPTSIEVLKEAGEKSKTKQQKLNF